MLVGVCVIACLTFRLCLPNALTRRAEVRSVFNRPPWTCRTSDPRPPGSHATSSADRRRKRRQRSSERAERVLFDLALGSN